MRMDVVELQNFYSQTDLGAKVSKIISKSLNPLIDGKSCEFIIGFGFTLPFMESIKKIWTFKGQKPKIISLMPGEQGVVPWPKNKRNVSVLVDETSWPINTSSADTILIAHGLEVSENQNDLLNEAFRVLDGKGKLILLVPNRTGFWARSDSTPFGFGKPYTINQLSFLLSQNQFNIDNIIPVLYGIPSKKGYWLKSINFWEAVGKKYNFPFFGGVLIVEASKSVYGAHKISAEKSNNYSSYGKATVST